MRDKKLTEILKQVREIADDLLFESLLEFDRSLKFNELKNVPGHENISCRTFNLRDENVMDLLKSLDPRKDLLVVAGSFYLLGKVIPGLTDIEALSFFRQFSDDFQISGALDPQKI